MRFLKRKMYPLLEKWKQDHSKKAFCIIGARQTGKTTLVREFAGKEYEQFIELNFIADESAKDIFNGKRNAESLIMAISAFTGKEIIPGKTLILLDEVQECPEARTAIKFLVEDGRCDYIETGSMLGVSLEKVKSYPVGFEEIRHMYPLDFEEFLWALDTPESVLNHLKDCYEELQPLNDTVHTTMLETYQRYLIIGGMPEVVCTYLDTHDLAAVLNLQKDLLNQYRNDIVKYANDSEIPSILKIYDAIPAQLDAKNQRFMVSQVMPKTRLTQIEDSFLWLALAGIALPCYNLAEPQPPLRLNEKRNLFKLFFLDPGLLAAFSMDPVQFQILQGDLSINQGSILENAIACELKSNGFELYYYNSKATGELDFIIQNDTWPDLLEVKSGKNWMHHPAMTKALSIKDWHFARAIVLCKGNIKIEDGIIYMPYYLAMYLKANPFQENSMVLDQIDFSHLDLSNL